MPVDVVNSVVIKRPLADVSQYAADPENASLWYENIRSVEWKTARQVPIGSQIDFVAHFLGWRLAYTYEDVEFVPGKRLTMRTPGAPFPMETTYTREDEHGATCNYRASPGASAACFRSARAGATSSSFAVACTFDHGCLHESGKDHVAFRFAAVH